MTPPGASDAEYTAPFNKAFQDINDGIAKAVESFNSLVAKVKHWAWLLGGAALLWIKHNLDNAREALEKVIEKVRYALEHQVPVLSLISVSFKWISDVKTPISEMSFAATEPDDEEMVKWTGDAASSYTRKSTQQKGAIDETVVKAEFISQWLFKIAKANVDFAVQLAKVVTGVAGKFVQAVIDASTVIDIPWAINELSGAVGTLVTEGLNTLVSIAQRFVEALGNKRDLATQVGDHSKLPGGLWPEAVRG